MAKTNKELINSILTRGVEQIYPNAQSLEKLLLSGKKIRLYVGFDPTGKHLHIGHASALRKLRQFQDLGHEVIMLVGTFTGMIGDPTDKMALRQKLTRKQVMENCKNYKKQASKILRFTGKNTAKLLMNHKWLGKLKFEDIIELASHFTVQQMLERDMFERRIKEGKPISLSEFLYPLMQGYDSVVMNVDLEVGGSDQIFNMLAGRSLMKDLKHKDKMVLAIKLITNDEGKKMSKSEGGFIALSDTPEDMYGKIMAMDDGAILSYFELATDVPMEEIERRRSAIKSGANPRDIKAELAFTVVSQYHDEKMAKKAQEHFVGVFQKHEIPQDMPEIEFLEGENIVDLLVRSKLVLSKSEGRRMIEQGGVKLDGQMVKDISLKIDAQKIGAVLQKGKRQFIRVI